MVVDIDVSAVVCDAPWKIILLHTISLRKTMSFNAVLRVSCIVLTVCCGVLIYMLHLYIFIHRFISFHKILVKSLQIDTFLFVFFYKSDKRVVRGHKSYSMFNCLAWSVIVKYCTSHTLFKYALSAF